MFWVSVTIPYSYYRVSRPGSRPANWIGMLPSGVLFRYTGLKSGFHDLKKNNWICNPKSKFFNNFFANEDLATLMLPLTCDNKQLQLSSCCPHSPVSKDAFLIFSIALSAPYCLALFFSYQPPGFCRYLNLWPCCRRCHSVIPRPHPAILHPSTRKQTHPPAFLLSPGGIFGTNFKSSFSFMLNCHFLPNKLSGIWLVLQDYLLLLWLS